MKTLKIAKENRGDKLDEFEALTTIAGTRSLTDEETKKLNQIEKDIRVLDLEIENLEKTQGNSLHKAKIKAMNTTFENIEETESMNLDFQIAKRVPVNRAMPATDHVLRNFDIAEKMQKANVYSVIAGLGGRKYQAGSVTDYALEQTKRSLTSSALLNPFLSAQLLDGGLSQSRLVQAGMKTFVMQEGTHKFARIDTYPELEWKAELAPTTERTAVFSPVTFAGKTLRGWIKMGGETLLNALNIEQAMRTVFNRAIGNGVDTAGLIGAGGADEPLGVANYVGVPTVAWNSTLDNYDAFVQGQKLVYDEDGPDLSATILSPDAWSQLARAKGYAEYQPIRPPMALENHKFLQTSKIQPDGSDETLAVMGGFESLNLGVRLSAEIILTPVIAETYSYNMLAVFNGDFQPNRVEDFAVITDIAASPALT